MKKAIFFITSDHGEAFMQHGRMLHGSTVFDEMIHVPFIVVLPQELNFQPRRISNILSLIDIPATILDIFDIKDEANFPGNSLIQLIFESSNAPSMIYSETLLEGIPKITVRDRNFKFISSSYEGSMLFDISEDPGEKQDLKSSRKVTTGFYRQALRKFYSPGDRSYGKNKPRIFKLNEDTIKGLKGLGYLR